MLYYFVIRKKNSDHIVGTACAIYRYINEINYWYLCDLKIDPLCRGNGLTMILFLKLYELFLIVTAKMLPVTII